MKITYVWDVEEEPKPPKDQNRPQVIRIVTTKSHSFWGTFFDFCMVILTCGLWLIWIAIRYLRTH